MRPFSVLGRWYSSGPRRGRSPRRVSAFVSRARELPASRRGHSCASHSITPPPLTGCTRAYRSNRRASSCKRPPTTLGATEGLQFVSSLGGGESEVIAFDRLQTLYVRANALGLTSIYSLSSTDATTFAGEWMTVTPSDSEYGSIAYATTLASDFGQVRFAGAISESGVITYKGRRVRALKGTVPPLDGAPKFAGTLYVTATKKPLPVAFVEVNAKATVTVSWSSWGHHYVLHAPSGAVAFPTS